MTEGFRNCVDAAIKFSNEPANKGDAFHLRMELVTGRIVEGPIFASDPEDPVIRMQVVKTDGQTHEPEDAFIYKQQVSMATVVW
jgi:hypothetical protein